jgi:hypothetical protein
MGIEVFLVGKAFGVSFLLVSGFLRLLVFLKWVEMLEELGSLGWYGIVQGYMDIESTRSLERIIESVGVVGGSKQN